MDLSERVNRTWLCSVVFMDIVGYSKNSLAHQLALKERFNAVVNKAVNEHMSAPDLITLDTGDGAALCYLGDPENVLFCALDLMHLFRADSELGVRIGINLGPVKVVKDVAGRPNAIGDGINTAQRVMSFADSNQILVSRSYYEVVGSLSDDYPHLFAYLGIRQDKHVREHEVYSVISSGGAHPEPAAETEAPAPDRDWDAAWIEKIEKTLAGIVGPLAPVLVRNAKRSATDNRSLLEALAAQIPNTAERAVFVTKVQNYADAGDATPAPSPAAPPQHPSIPARQAAHPIDPAELAVAERRLAAFIGPMARIMVKKAAAESATLAALYVKLAAELPPAEQQRFLREAGQESSS